MSASGKARSPPLPEWLLGGRGRVNVDIIPVGSADLDERLVAMRGMGFRFGTSCDSAGLVVALVAARVHHGVIDIIQIFGEHDADATRVSCDEPDILFPRAVFWRIAGPAAYVIDALLGLAYSTPNRNGWASRVSPAG